jgi:hypothetical protein
MRRPARYKRALPRTALENRAVNDNLYLIDVDLAVHAAAGNASDGRRCSDFDVKAADRFAKLVLACVHKEYNYDRPTLNA